MTLATLREQVSKLSQFPFFMKETIRENVRLARQGATDAEVEEACELAHIHEVITDPAKMHAGTTRWWTCRCRRAARSD